MCRLGQVAAVVAAVVVAVAVAVAAVAVAVAVAVVVAVVAVAVVAVVMAATGTVAAQPTLAWPRHHCRRIHCIPPRDRQQRLPSL